MLYSLPTMTRHHVCETKETGPHSSWGASQNTTRLKARTVAVFGLQHSGFWSRIVWENGWHHTHWTWPLDLDSLHLFTSCKCELCSPLKHWDVEVYSVCFRRLQPDCSSSDPLPGVPSSRSGGWSWFSRLPAFSWLVSFCTAVKGQAVSGWGSGRRRWHNSICSPRRCQLWRKGSGRGLIISLGGTAGVTILCTSDILPAPTADP